jgi:hypothetical protein
MNSVNKHSSNILGSFIGGAVKGIITGALLMGTMYLVFAGLPLIGLAVEMPAMFGASHLTGLVGILLTSGIVNGALKVHHDMHVQNEISHGRAHSAADVRTSPTMIPIPGLEHGVVSAEHALDVEHAPKRNWREATGHRTDRVQEILHNGSLSDKDRAAAILAEREQRSAAPQSQSI